MLGIVLLFLGHKYPVVYINSVVYVIKKDFTNERLTYFTKFTIQHVTYVIKQSVSPKMFTNESLFTIQRLLYQDSTVSIIILKGRIENIQPNIIMKNLSASSKSANLKHSRMTASMLKFFLYSLLVLLQLFHL